MRRFTAAYRRGLPPPTYLVRPMFQAFHPILRDASIVAYYKGMEFVYDSAPRQTGIVFSFKSTKREQQKRFRFPVADTRAMQQFYDAQALVILDRVSDKQERYLRESLVDITRRNLHVKDGIAEIEKTFAKAGIIPHNSYEAENIFRTQTQLAYAAGQYAAEQDPAIQAILKGYKYVSVGDSRVRQTHADLHGLVLHKNDAAWHTIAPPNGFSCRCQRIPVFDNRPFSTGFDPAIIDDGPDKGFDFHPGELAPINAKGTYKSWIENKAKVGGTHKGKQMPLEWWQGKLAQYEKRAGIIVVNPLTVDVVPSVVKLNAEQIEAETVALAERLNADEINFSPFHKGVQDSFTLAEKRELLSITNEALDEIEKSTTKKLPRLREVAFHKTPIALNENLNGQYRDDIGSGASVHIKYLHQGKKRVFRKKLSVGSEWVVEDSVRGAVRHELGHHAASDTQLFNEWVGVGEATGVSQYAITNDEERFAESFSAYTSSQYANTPQQRLPPTIETFFIKHFGKHPNLK